MKMEDFHCGTLELSFEIAAKGFNKDAFLKETGSEDKEGLGVYLAFDSKEYSGKQHAHMGVESRSGDKVSVRISYHDTEGRVEDENAKPPRMEECAKWLGKFIKPSKIKAAVIATYFFDKAYAPPVKLPYKLKLPETGLEGGLVTGLSIQFPAESVLEFALIQRTRDLSAEDFGVSVGAHAEMAIKKFDLYEELKRLEPSVMALVRKREQRHGKRPKK